ncbi:hypothetical protein WDU94_009749, partial [Cyamophila willieti]
LGPRLLFVILDPDLIQKVFCIQTNLQKDPLIYGMMDSMLNGPALLTNNVIPKWKKHRKIISHASFRMKSLKSYVSIFHEEATILANKLGDQAVHGQAIEPEKMVGLATLSMVVRTMSGLDLKIQQNFHDKHPAIDAVEDALEVSFPKEFIPT